MISIKKLQELTKKLNILYVEDDEAIQRSMGQYLQKLFAKVVYASDGLEGLKKYQTQMFDLVMTDLSMPKMDGIEMIKQIKNLHKEQSILITTAHSESDYMLDAIKLGIDGYILKPFENEQLNNELFKIATKLNIVEENEEYKLYLKDMVKEKTSELRHMIDFQTENYDKTLFSMVELIEQRDTYTAGHSKRVAEYSKKIAQEMGYGEPELTMIYQAGILHDVGKVGTPDSVLLNPQQLNKIEYQLIQEHVEVSFKLLNTIPMFKGLAEIVHSHHERYDGTGYPRGIGGNDIVPLARIMIVADSFDAMTTNRIYKGRKTVDEALKELKKFSSKQFHPEVVEKAVIALANVEIDESINQLPKSKLEEERFAYFYKDTLSEAHNQNYLDIVLMQNFYKPEYKFLDIFFINNFSKYNKEHGWKEGDKVLTKFSNILCDNFLDSIVFRVFGDDFVVISREKLDIQKTEVLLSEALKDKKIGYRIKHIDLCANKINKISQIENL